jgi:hypothetical protein
MRVILLSAGVLVAACAAAHSAEITSAYTDVDLEKGCVTIAKAAEDDGDWARFVCPGYMGYPIVVDYSDLRESITYGFPSAGRAWESFEGFNSGGAKVEWRLLKDGAATTPFAAIQRWTVTSAENGEKNVEVLVVSRVGQPDDLKACVVGLVLATGKPDANEMARKIADEQAREFSCGDERTVVGEPMPVFLRTESEPQTP